MEEASSTLAVPVKMKAMAPIAWRISGIAFGASPRIAGLMVITESLVAKRLDGVE